MKRLGASVLLIAFLCTLGLCGCSREDNEVQSSQKVVRIATDLRADDAAYRQLKRFAQNINDLSEGQFKIKLYESGKWDADDSLLDYLDTVAVEMVCVAHDKLTAQIPQYELYSYPSLFSDAEQLSKYALSEAGQAALNLSSDYQMLGFGANGYSYFLHKYWAENYYNYKGSSFYAQIPQTSANALKNLGIGINIGENNTPGFNHIVTEGYLAYLEQVNVVNESNYVSDPDVYYNLELVAVSQKFWNDLSADEQAMITEAFNTALKEECAYQKGREFREVLANGGVSFISWSEASKQAAYQALRPLTENYIRESQNALGGYFLPVSVIGNEEGM